MYVLLEISDAAIYDLSKMPNIGRILDSSFKKQRGQLITQLAHSRSVFIAFDVWFMSLDPTKREHLWKSIKSTLPIDEIVPLDLPNRELVVEAIERFRDGTNDITTAEESVNKVDPDHQ